MQEQSNFILSMEIKISQILLALIIILVFISAATRWLGIPIVWSNDIAQLLFVWVSFLGGDLALRKDEHIGVDIITRKLPERANNILKVIIYTLLIVFLMVIIFYGVRLSIDAYKRMFNSTEISFSWAVMSAPIGSALMITTLIKKIRHSLKN